MSYRITLPVVLTVIDQAVCNSIKSLVRVLDKRFWVLGVRMSRTIRHSHQKRRSVLFRDHWNSSSPAHWSKDFVEHLRTVHFTLIGVAIGLILIVLSTKPYNIVVALREIQEIRQLKKSWSPTWVANLGQTKLIGDLTNKEFVSRVVWDNKKVVADQNLPTVIRFTRPKRDYFVLFSSVPSYQVRPSLSPLDEFPNTLLEFRHWWNALGDNSRIVFVPYALVQGDGGVYLPPRWSKRTHEPEPRSQIGKLQLDARRSHSAPILGQVDLDLYVDTSANPDGGELDKRGTSLYRGVDDKGNVFEIPVDILRIDLTQAALTNNFASWKAGGFDSVFHDLAVAAHDFEALELDDIVKLISDEAAKGSEVFEAFGMKFPAGQITAWGIVILVGVQLYFFVYLKQLSGKLGTSDVGWDVPWIGMDISPLAQVIFFLTIVLLPFAAVALLGEHTISHLSGPVLPHFRGSTVKTFVFSSFPSLAKVAFLVIGLISALMLGVLSWKYRPKLKAPKSQNVKTGEETSTIRESAAPELPPTNVTPSVASQNIPEDK